VTATVPSGGPAMEKDTVVANSDAHDGGQSWDSGRGCASGWKQPHKRLDPMVVGRWMDSGTLSPCPPDRPCDGDDVNAVPSALVQVVNSTHHGQSGCVDAPRHERCSHAWLHSVYSILS